MHLSTSSFERELVPARWGAIFLVSLCVLICFAALMELWMSQLGYMPTVEDSEKKWAAERARASRLGDRALALIGASRFQLGLDLEILRQTTGLEPVQLAIDGTSFVPILRGLANDPTFTGTVLIDYYNSSVMNFASGGVSTRYQAYYDNNGGGSPISGSDVEMRLTDWIHERLRVYADGASPYQSLVLRVLEQEKDRRYLVTLPTRERLADYSKAKMPTLYYYRVLRELGLEKQMSPLMPEIKQILSDEIAKVVPENIDSLSDQVKSLADMVARIERRGGRVAFVAMPTSGLVAAYEEKRYPAVKFWNRFKDNIGVQTLRSADIPALRGFVCPDGSHLDYRDRSRFTRLLADSLIENGLLQRNKLAKMEQQ